jgi:hypothetical protein
LEHAFRKRCVCSIAPHPTPSPQTNQTNPFVPFEISDRANPFHGLGQQLDFVINDRQCEKSTREKPNPKFCCWLLVIRRDSLEIELLNNFFPKTLSATQPLNKIRTELTFLIFESKFQPKQSPELFTSTCSEVDQEEVVEYDLAAGKCK